ncbi:hypothetical protein AKJ09_05569 [Labilithrix luteola]|uniref:Zinc metalloprotease n=1 Tax=Labilithrix luteola TaxID=1391654 RepID=A0A0K1PZE3_9BACT|nr:site-2 protease family protein [Labilithrix luteola]AKU98905.1 hypothetical protein AKJ09_05569 [Labilithrix luteola]
MRNAIRIGKLFGVEFRLDSSWLFIFALVIWSLVSVFSRWHPDWTIATGIIVAILAALAFFGSVLFHELAHSLVARIYGIPVRDITLHMFGGVSNIEREPPTPGAEFLIAIVGPISSVLLGIGMLVLVAFLTGVTMHGAQFESAEDAVAHMGPLTTLLVWLGPVNIMVGLFNLIPGFPLDGGRILRSILWKATGNLQRATRWSTTIGQLVGWAFIVMGIFMAFGYRVPFFGTGVGGGIWLGLIGLFLRNAAMQHQVGAAVEGALSGVHVGDVMRTNGPWVSASISLRTLVNEFFIHREDEAYPVFDGTQFVGVVAFEDMRRIPVEAWDLRTARDVMTKVTDLVTVKPTDDAFEALRLLGNAAVRQLPVLYEGALVGVVYQNDIARWLELHSRTGGRMAPPRPRHA